jgi:large subunit ribosomal protein L5
MLDEETQPENNQAPDSQAENAPETVASNGAATGQAAAEPATSADGGGRQGAPRRSRRQRAGQEASSGGVAVAEAVPSEPSPRLLEQYRNEIIPAMMREFGYSNPMEVPRLRKIVLNIGLGEALVNGRALEAAAQDLTTISGQKPVITRARKSIAGFKIRQGNAIGTAVTLRGARMYHFLDRLVNTALPRIRDFRGIPRRGLDGRGNFSIGIREQIIFPEIDYNQIDRIRGLQVTIATTARNDAEALRLLELYGFPFIRAA